MAAATSLRSSTVVLIARNAFTGHLLIPRRHQRCKRLGRNAFESFYGTFGSPGPYALRVSAGSKIVKKTPVRDLKNPRAVHIEYNTGYPVSPEVSARPRPSGDPTRGRAGTEGDAEYTVLEAFDNGFRTGPYRKVRPGLEPVIERYRGSGMI
ncbi:hypothetical protein Bbelb_102760 [Branchiostoma belcheri]|nr:hypothetical protein Bbelb_102760 [Branchiostoma belcheri]